MKKRDEEIADRVYVVARSYAFHAMMRSYEQVAEEYQLSWNTIYAYFHKYYEQHDVQGFTGYVRKKGAK